MIYIFSESNDTTTDGVIQSLINRNADYVRMDLDLNYLGIDFGLNNFSDIEIRIYYGEYEYLINKQDSIWFRRGNISSYLFLNNQYNLIYQTFIANEKRALEEFIVRYLRNNFFCIGNPLIFSCSKLDVLYFAIRCGFRIPRTFLTYKRSSLEKVGLTKFVAKPIGDILFQKIGSELHHTYVEKYKLCEINQYFGNTLFQEFYSSESEIRVLTVLDNIFAVELCFKNKSHVDSRHSTNSDVNYNKVFLSAEIKRQIIELNYLMNTNMSIIDFIKISDGSLLLIDFNPCGQYEEIRDYCFPEIDDVISKILYEKS